MKSKLEYIWLDGYMPTQSLRSKTQVIDNFGGTLEECPMWSFDGSSTEQADGSSSDCLLKPVAIFPDPGRLNSYLVMTEVLNADGTPHVSNGRATIDDDDDDFWFGFEQEYFLWDIDTNLPPGFPPGGYPGPQGPGGADQRRPEPSRGAPEPPQSHPSGSKGSLGLPAGAELPMEERKMIVKQIVFLDPQALNLYPQLHTY